MLNVVPMYFVVKNNPSTKGSWHDVDFWVLISNSSIAFLGIVTAMYPYHNIWREVSHSRRWANCFAIIGMLCVPAGIVTYLFLSRRWSTCVCFCGMAIQAIKGLQLVLDTGKYSAVM